ncbi:MAG: hypothetical protein HYX87_08965 [Chloroflexi bacterium]|nr:hypothetical protein [Chloroflexota bacterium]
MADTHLQSLEESEAEVRNATLSTHHYELDIIKGLFDCYLAGFNTLSKFTYHDDNKREYLWLLLTARTFNSLRCAYDFLQKGYHSQSVILNRAAEEDYVTCRALEKDIAIADALLDTTGTKRLPSFQTMAEAISYDFCRNIWKPNYGQLSQLAHPRALAIRVMTDPDITEISLGPHYYDALFVATCHSILRTAVGMTEFLVRLLGPNALDWQRETLPFVTKASEYVARISSESRKTLDNNSESKG